MKKEVQLTKKSLTIDDLSNASHVGFTTLSAKGHIVFIGNDKYTPISINHTTMSCNNHYSGGYHFSSTKDVIEYLEGRIIELYVFDTRKELYQWLAED